MKALRPELHCIPIAHGASRVSRPLAAVVLGGGIAGVAAATVLAERGVRVTLLERSSALGGRAGAFEELLPTGERLQMERGFHGFFRQYYALRALLRRIDPALSMLRPLEDYPVLGPDGMLQSFRSLPKRAPLNVAALTLRTPYLSARELLRVNGRAALEMLAYDPLRTYAQFDAQSAEAYLRSLRLPETARRMLLDVFAHSFFNREREMSAAELLMMFHFYFTGNPEGLLFDVVRRPLGVALWEPFAAKLEALGVELRFDSEAFRVRRDGRHAIAVEHAKGETRAELLVLALDVSGLRALVERSPDLAALRPAVARLGVTRPFAVLRLWLDRPLRADRPAFAGTAGMGFLDNVSVYDRFQDESADWARAHGGSVVELHAYAVPPLLGEAQLRRDLLDGLHALYPEAARARIVHERLLVRRDCPAFPPGGHAARPSVTTPLPDVALSGDALRMPFPCALMERAAASGFLAASYLLAPFGVASEPIASVPRRGLLAGLLQGTAAQDEPLEQVCSRPSPGAS